MGTSFYKKIKPAGEISYAVVGMDLRRKIEEEFLKNYWQRQPLISLLENRREVSLEETCSEGFYLNFSINCIISKASKIEGVLTRIAIYNNISSIMRIEKDFEKFRAKNRVKYEFSGNQYLEVGYTEGDILNQPVVLFFPDPGLMDFWNIGKYIQLSEEEVERILQYCKTHIPESNWNSDELTDGQFMGFIEGKLIPFEEHTKVIKNLDHVAGFLDLIEEILQNG